MTDRCQELRSYFKVGLSIKDYKKLRQDLMKGIRHRYLFCGCPACLYPGRRNIDRDNLFFTWLVYQTEERKTLKNQRIVLRYKWKEAIDLMFKISGKRYKIPRYARQSNIDGHGMGGFLAHYNVYNISTRYIRQIIERIRKKYLKDLWIAIWEGSPEGKYVREMMGQLHSLKIWKTKQARLYDRFQRRLYKYITDERAVTFRDLCRHFSGKRRDQIEREIVLPVPHGAGMIVGLLGKNVALYVGKDTPMSQTIDRLRLISRTKGHSDLEAVAQVLEMFSAGREISRQLYQLAGLKLEETDESWIVTAEGTRMIREWSEEGSYSIGKEKSQGASKTLPA